MADVIATDYVLIFYLSSRLILLPDIVVDVKTTFGRCYLPSGRWNSHILQQMADVIAKWQMLWPQKGGMFGFVFVLFSGSWNSHGSILA